MSAERFFYRRCSRCELLFLEPVPPDLSRYYPPEYYEFPSSLEELSKRARSQQGWKIDWLLRFARQGRLLEIGPAYGLFAYMAKQAGFAVTVVERNEGCCHYLRRTVGVDAIAGAASADLIDGMSSFDVIVLWQVVEHLDDVWNVLAAACRRLAPGGLLLIDTPNPAAFQFAVLGSRWTHVDAPRHTVLIPESVLTAFVQAQGLSLVEVSSSNPGAYGYNSFGWAHSLGNLFAPGLASKAAFTFGRLLNKLLMPVERTGGRGSTYVAVYQQAGK